MRISFVSAAIFGLAAILSTIITSSGRAQIAPLPPVPGVAVFSEPDFPRFGISSFVTPEAIARDLRAAGLSADLLGAEAIANPEKFNAQHYSALVLPNGNGYPRNAFTNLLAFHHAGGSLITTGIPFTHAVENRQGKWSDLGHKASPALWGKEGIGVGGFAGGGDSPGVGFAPTGDDPLRLAALMARFPKGETKTQWLDPESVPVGVRIVPAVGEVGRPLVALVVHEGDAFRGAVDAWTDGAPEGDWEDFLTRQLIARGTVAALQKRGLLSASLANTAFRKLDSLPRPILYADLQLPAPPRRYETFQPKMPTLSRHLYVADLRGASRDEKELLISLQGIVNAKQPRIYYIFEDEDRFWLDELQRKGETDTPLSVADLWALIRIFRSEVRGAVLCDPKVYASPCVAFSLAGVDRLLVAQTPEIAAKANMPVTVDLRGRFRDDADAFHYIRTVLLPRLNPWLCYCNDPIGYDSGSLDSIVAAHGAVFCITGPKAQGKLPGANQAGEMEEVKALLARLPLGAVVRGFWPRGGGMGITEDEGVALGGRFGKITLVSDRITNLSVHSAVKLDRLVQKARPIAPPLDRSKVYLCFTMSDGDNLCTWRDYFHNYFNDPVRGSFPIGWGMSPAILDLAPGWARWYYENATPNDEFICDVSGIAYMYPSSWGTALRDRPVAFRYFYGWTQRYMGLMDMKTLRLMHVDAADIARVGPMLPDIDFLMPDYGYAGGDYSRLTYRLPAGQAVFRAVTSGKGPENLADQIRKRAGSARPAFVNAFIWNWGSRLSDLKQTLELLGPGYVAVTPSQLNTLYRQALGRDGLKRESVVGGRGAAEAKGEAGNGGKKKGRNSQGNIRLPGSRAGRGGNGRSFRLAQGSPTLQLLQKAGLTSGHRPVVVRGEGRFEKGREQAEQRLLGQQLPVEGDRNAIVPRRKSPDAPAYKITRGSDCGAEWRVQLPNGEPPFQRVREPASGQQIVRAPDLCERIARIDQLDSQIHGRPPQRQRLGIGDDGVDLFESRAWCEPMRYKMVAVVRQGAHEDHFTRWPLQIAQESYRLRPNSLSAMRPRAAARHPQKDKHTNV